MGLRVNTNIASLNAQNNLSNVTMRLQGNYARLSSGLRITRASDDAAGLALSEKMRAKIRSYDQAGRNAQDGISLVQTAEGSMEEAGNLLNRIRELAVQSANGTLGATERTTINNEVQSAITEIDRIANTSEFNGVNLLDGSTTTATIQVGVAANQTIAVALQDSRAVTLGVSTLDVSTVVGANSAITAVDTAINTLAQNRGKLGASQNRLQSAYSTIQTSRENLSAAESRIRDVDVAHETADLTRNTILQQAATSILQQANMQPQIALSLLKG